MRARAVPEWISGQLALQVVAMLSVGEVVLMSEAQLRVALWLTRRPVKHA